MRSAVVLAAVCLAVSGCGGDESNPGRRSGLAVPSASGTGTARVEEPVAPASASAAPAPSRPASDAAPLELTSARAAGRQGRTTWSMELPEVAGPLGPEVERRVRRSADEGVARLAGDAPDDVDSSVDVTTEVTRNDGRTVQVLLRFSFFAQGAPHPLNEVSTVVLQRSDAVPVLLTDVLAEPTPALAATLRHASRVAAEDGREDPAGSLSADVEDWADWQATPDGLTFFFDDHQAGSYAAGLRELDVPWSVVRPWVRDEAYRLLGPA